MKVELVKPQGYCAGVLNAIKIALKAKEENPKKKVYILGMLVHNAQVIDELTNNGLITLNEVEIPNFIKKGDVIVFTAHGHNEKLNEIALNRGLIIYDCTCPIVKQNLDIIKKEIKDDNQVIYIGQKMHKETEAALSISNKISLYDINDGINWDSITSKSPLVINQTTLNFHALNDIHADIISHIPGAKIENEICSATRLRQEAVNNISRFTDLIIIVGDKRSSNSNRLYEIATKKFPNKDVFMVQNLDELIKINPKGHKKATICSGASTPIGVVQEIKDYLNNLR